MTPLLLADVAPSDIGQWVLTAAAVLGLVALTLNIVGSWKRLTRQQSEGDRFITHTEFDKAEKSIRTELERRDLGTRKRVHGLANALQAMKLDQARQPQQTRAMIEESIKPLARNLGRIAAAVIAICVKMEIEPPKPDDI